MNWPEVSAMRVNWYVTAPALIPNDTATMLANTVRATSCRGISCAHMRDYHTQPRSAYCEGFSKVKRTADACIHSIDDCSYVPRLVARIIGGATSRHAIRSGRLENLRRRPDRHRPRRGQT